MKKLPALQKDTDVRMYVKIERFVRVRIKVYGEGLDLCIDSSSDNYVEVVEFARMFIRWS